MSGGYWAYKQYNIQQIADDIDIMIMTNEGGYTEETLEKFKNATYYLRMTFIYATAIDKLLSYDFSEESFNQVVDETIRLEDQAFRRKLKESE